MFLMHALFTEALITKTSAWVQDYLTKVAFFGVFFFNSEKHKAIIQMYNHPKSFSLEVLPRRDW